MKEQLISFETAILAHSKNFNWIDKRNTSYCSIYNIAGEIKNAGIKQLTSWINYWQKDPTDTRYNSLALVPTQSLLQKWLRENHKIFIDCSHSRINDDGEVTLYQTQITSVSIGESYNFKHHKESNDCYGETYEEALEVGLYQALKLI